MSGSRARAQAGLEASGAGQWEQAAIQESLCTEVRNLRSH